MVNYDTPTAQGGVPPVSVTCAPPSGFSFPIGSTATICTAQDARMQIESCSFTVTVTPPPQLRATTFVAFGDSITEGVLSRANPFASFSPGVPHSYPFKLHASLVERYTAQMIQMENAGVGGELAIDGARRLPGVLSRLRPEVVLLLEGLNDLQIFGSPGIGPATDAVRRMAGDARATGARVYIATLSPVVPGRSAFASIGPFNDNMRRLATEVDGTLVDVFVAFGNDFGLLGADGLHPNEAGYDRIAQTFYDRIRSTLESPSTSALGSFQALTPPWRR